MTYAPNGREKRLEQDYERLGTRDPKCVLCPETEPSALTGFFPNIYCTEHDAERRGMTAMEQQHPPGRRNSRTTVVLRKNHHAMWDDYKKEWPEKTLKNPHGSPLRGAAAGVRSVLDWFRALLERILGWVPKFLEQLDEKLEEIHGPYWWNGWGLEWPTI